MKTSYLKSDNPYHIAFASEIIRTGGLVAFPTETVYGLGANALDEAAVEKIFQAKGRPSDNPLILHISDENWLERYCVDIPTLAFEIASQFWPGPLTLILRRNPIVPDRTTGGLDTVAIRCPNHPVALKLIRESGVAIAAPSANRSGRPSCTTAAHVLADMDGRIDCILDGGYCTVGVESTILDLTVMPPRLLRPGGLPLEELEAVIGEIAKDDSISRPMRENTHPSAPGMKYRHYAPRAPVTAVTGSPAKSAQYIYSHVSSGEGVLCCDEFAFLFPDAVVQTFGSLQNHSEQAQRVFCALRAFDDTTVRHIFAQCPDSAGLGFAVENRIKKAAGFDVTEADLIEVPQRPFILIGITGGTGAGKTTALRQLSQLDVHVIDCDQVYHELLISCTEMLDELRERFGDEIFTSAGLDRKKLGAIVFRDESALADLNRITHKYVEEETDRQIKDAQRAGMTGAAVDAIALLEGNLAARCDCTVGIIAPVEDRVNRLISREGITEEYARFRIAAQKPDDFYREHCDFILENNVNQAEFVNNANKLFQTILEGIYHE